MFNEILMQAEDSHYQKMETELNEFLPLWVARLTISVNRWIKKNPRKFIAFSILLALSLAGGYMALLVYSITALVKTSHEDIQDECSSSNLWIYMIVVLAVSWFQGAAKKNTNDAVNNTIMFAIKSAIDLTLSVGVIAWGGYELWGVSCANELHSEMLYTVAEIYFFLYCIGSIMLGVIVYIAAAGIIKTVAQIQQ